VGHYTPGQVVAATGLSLDTLRYYERVGLIPRVDRTAGGRRRYDEVDLAWLSLVRCLRDTDMPIAEIRRFTELVQEGSTGVSARVALLETHAHTVEETIRRLRVHLTQIRGKIDHLRVGEAWKPSDGARPDGARPDGARPDGARRDRLAAHHRPPA
jgi:DNA-binding transcriptional MerR regulator